MKRNFLIISDDIEIKNLITLIINENTASPIKQIETNCIYNLMLKNKSKENYDFVFFDARFLDYPISTLLEILQNLFVRAYFIIINNEKSEKNNKIKNISLGQITIKDNFVFENFAARVKTLIDTGNKNRRYINQTNNLLNIYNNIQTLCDLIPNNQDFNLNKELETHYLASSLENEL